MHELKEIPVADISPDPGQPRKDFDEEKLIELAESIRAIGLKQPITVQERPEGSSIETPYLLVAGERRLRAHLMIGWPSITCIIERNEVDALVFQLVENLHREPLNPIEEAFGYKRLKDERNWTNREVAKAVGKHEISISCSLQLIKLAPEIQEQVRGGTISAVVGLEIARRCTSHDDMRWVIETILKTMPKGKQQTRAITLGRVRAFLDQREGKTRRMGPAHPEQKPEEAKPQEDSPSTSDSAARSSLTPALTIIENAELLLASIRIVTAEIDEQSLTRWQRTQLEKFWVNAPPEARTRLTKTLNEITRQARKLFTSTVERPHRETVHT